MIREIVTDTFFLQQPSAPAEKKDLPVVRDLLDTLRANADCCVGLAANMIGVRKRILVLQNGADVIAMLNPVITAHAPETYEAEEGCLSLQGVRKTMRYAAITVTYYDQRFKQKKQSFLGFPAQIIQHEMDHFAGILI